MSEYRRPMTIEEVNKVMQAIAQIKDYLRKEDANHIESDKTIEKELDRIDDWRHRPPYDGWGDKPTL